MTSAVRVSGFRRGVCGAAAFAVVALGLVMPAGSGAALPTDPQAADSAPLTQIRLGQAVERLARFPVDITVATPDTGLDLDHPDLAPRLFSLPSPVRPPCQYPGAFCDALPDVAAGAAGWDMIGTTDPCANGGFAEQPDPDPSDPAGCSGHGTAVTGALGAAWNNGKGGAGVAPNARLIALRTCWDFDNCFGHVQPVAFDWAADRGARVITMSWSQNFTQATLDSIARNSNTLFVAIAGGNGGAIDAEAGGALPYPCAADLPNILCVTTASPTDGLDCGPYGATVVDVAVPTRGIVTTLNGGGFGNGGCATSYASPIAGGLATLLFGLVPEATPAQVKAAIIDGARDAAAWQGKSVSGGVLDALGAVNVFQDRFGLQPPEPPPGNGCANAQAALASAKSRRATALERAKSAAGKVAAAKRAVKKARNSGKKRKLKKAKGTLEKAGGRQDRAKSELQAATAAFKQAQIAVGLACS